MSIWLTQGRKPAQRETQRVAAGLKANRTTADVTPPHICCSCFPAQCPPLFWKMSWAPPLSGIFFTTTSTTEYLTVQQIKWQMLRFVEKSSAVHSLKYYTNVFYKICDMYVAFFTFIIYFLLCYLHAYSLLYKISYANKCRNNPDGLTALQVHEEKFLIFYFRVCLFVNKQINACLGRHFGRHFPS